MNESQRIVTVHTPTGGLALVRSVAEKLLAEGVICGGLDKVVHATDAATVKAAIMSHSVCGFCSVPGASHLFDVPDFELPDTIGTSVGGWMACDVCADLVRSNNRTGLFKRTTDLLAFPKFTRKMLQSMHDRFWMGIDATVEAKAISEGIEGFVEDNMKFGHKAKITDRERRVEAVSRLVGIPEDEVEKFIKGAPLSPAIAKKLVEWRRTFGTRTPSEVADMLNGSVKPPLPQGHIPHWQQALDAKLSAVSLIGMAVDDKMIQRYTDAVDVKDPVAVRKMMQRSSAFQTLRELGFREDLKYLRAADAYSFNHETIDAIREAANSIPHDSPLSAVETPNVGAGWFWFSDPMPVTASPVSSNETDALLWGWSDGELIHKMDLSKVADKLPPETIAMLEQRHRDKQHRRITDAEAGELGDTLKAMNMTPEDFDKLWTTERVPALMFSAYVVDKKNIISGKRDQVMPSTRWYWPLDMSYDEMLDYNGRSWDKTYGPGSEFEKSADIIGRDATLKCIGGLSLFFLAACVWFKQRIIVASPGHIERHARKRMVKEHKLSEQPSVRVIALRASVKQGPAEPRERKEGGPETREYHYRWIVKGHPRLQVCGPGRRDRKLIWIDPYPKGPEDKPLRTREKVFAVIR